MERYLGRDEVRNEVFLALALTVRFTFDCREHMGLEVLHRKLVELLPDDVLSIVESSNQIIAQDILDMQDSEIG